MSLALAGWICAFVGLVSLAVYMIWSSRNPKTSVTIYYDYDNEQGQFRNGYIIFTTRMNVFASTDLLQASLSKVEDYYNFISGFSSTYTYPYEAEIVEKDKDSASGTQTMTIRFYANVTWEEHQSVQAFHSNEKKEKEVPESKNVEEEEIKEDTTQSDPSDWGLNTQQNVPPPGWDNLDENSSRTDPNKW